MLKKFLLNVLSSFMGAWIAIVLSGVCLVLVVMGVIGIVMGKNMSINKDSVLKISLSGDIVERDDPGQLDLMSIISNGSLNYQTVETLVTAIKEAKTNDKIKAIYLDCGALSAAPASVDAIRDALIDYKKSGKKIYAYGDHYSQSAYFIATSANELYLNPVGSVDLHGLGGQSFFYKDLFDKIGLQFQVVRVGEGKSAVEPYTQNSMSDYARNQTMQVIDTIWSGLRGEIAQSRGLSSAALDSLISNQLPAIREGNFALNQKLVDGLMYRHEFEKRIATAVGQEDGLEDIVAPSFLANLSDMQSFNNSDNQIAVVYACGEIDSGLDSGINSEELVKEIIRLGEDENVKGMVLRVNSPGGSAFGSEQIWEAVEWFKGRNKPVAVSMGDYAASGGYYISCGANRIYADRFTLTGSIGIFGLIPNIKGLLDKIGVNAETVATNPEAQLFTLTAPLNEHQLASLQQMVDDGYNLFVKRCAEGRGIPVEKIKEIADGRPIAATVALRYKLIDQIGSLDDAIAWTATKAGVGKDYSVMKYPEITFNFLTQFYRSENVKLPEFLRSFVEGQNLSTEMIGRIGAFLKAHPLRAESVNLKIQL